MPRSKHGQQLLGDAGPVCAELRRGETTLIEVVREYGVAIETFHKIVQPRLRPGEWRWIVHATHCRAGRKGGFQKGHVPFNKNRKGTHFSPATEFKPGTMHGRALILWAAVGTIRVRHDKLPRHLRDRKRRPGSGKRTPRRFIKVKDDGRAQDRWVAYGRYVWAQAHGPIPAGMRVDHADGDSMNDAVGNLVLATMAEHAARQLRLHPDHLAKLRLHAGKMAAERWARRRELLAMGVDVPKHSRWECPACGWHADQKCRPERCAKCGGSQFEEIRPTTLAKAMMEGDASAECGMGSAE